MDSYINSAQIQKKLLNFFIIKLIINKCQNKFPEEYNKLPQI